MSITDINICEWLCIQNIDDPGAQLEIKSRDLELACLRVSGIGVLAIDGRACHVEPVEFSRVEWLTGNLLVR